MARASSAALWTPFKIPVAPRRLSKLPCLCLVVDARKSSTTVAECAAFDALKLSAISRRALRASLPLRFSHLKWACSLHKCPYFVAKLLYLNRSASAWADSAASLVIRSSSSSANCLNAACRTFSTWKAVNCSTMPSLPRAYQSVNPANLSKGGEGGSALNTGFCCVTEIGWEAVTLGLFFGVVLSK